MADAHALHNDLIGILLFGMVVWEPVESVK